MRIPHEANEGRVAKGLSSFCPMRDFARRLSGDFRYAVREI